MRKTVRICIGVMLFCLWGVGIVELTIPGSLAKITESTRALLPENQTHEIPDVAIPLGGPDMENGKQYHDWLHVENGKLINHNGEPVQLRGMSSHGLAWYPEYTSLESIATTKQYGANLFRVAMYVDDDAGNYTLDAKDQAKNKRILYEAIENALRLDMYAIADWHILKQGNPLLRVSCAVAFFDELSRKYANESGVLYEICNEPNGDTSWDDIVAYAQQVIPVIRKNAPQSIIIVGTPNHSTDLQSPIHNPLPYDNIMYAFHYYPGIAKDGYITTLDAAAAAGLPVFISEWGVDRDIDTYRIEERYPAEFLTYAKEKGISWANWSLCNKDETYSAIRAYVDKQSGWSEDDLTWSGRIVFKALGE